MNIIDFIIFSAIKTIVPILLLLIPFFIWLFLALNPKNRAMVKIKFDYRKSKTSFYNKGIVFAAIFFWLLILFVGISQSDPQTTILILGLISSIYIICIIRYLYHRHKQNLQKHTRDSRKHFWEPFFILSSYFFPFMN